MSDSELIEMAAKVVGIDGSFDVEMGALKSATKDTPYGSAHSYWNPLTEDGDAFRLAIALGLTVSINSADQKRGGRTMVWTYGVPKIQERHEADAAAATRRAIVRAVASLPLPTPEGAQT